MAQQHFLIVTFPAQGHINPALQLAQRLVELNNHVTFVSTVFALSHYINPTKFISSLKSVKNDRISFASFSDGYDSGRPSDVKPHHYMSQFRECSIQALPSIITKATALSKPRVTCVIYSILLPWVPDTANSLNLPSALLWIQPAAILGIYYHYFNGHGESIKNVIQNRAHDDNGKKSSCFIKFPKLPLSFSPLDLPSHLVTTPFALPSFKEHLEVLSRQESPLVLVNSFDALEPEALKNGTVDDESKIKLYGIGPLVPLPIFDKKTTTLSCVENHDKCVEWLNSKTESSVVYVSFGSTSVLPKKQMEEMVKGVLEIGAPFLWVVRVDEESNKPNDNGDEDVISNYREELEKQGLIVPWCNQVEVLSHPSVGCFLTHCGWNSSLESLVYGVPVVAFPQWADQPTNAKLVEDMWKIGVRMKSNKDGLVEGCEIKKCIEIVMESEEMSKNVKVLKELAKEAVMENGLSDKNLKCFIRKTQESTFHSD